MYIPDDFLNKGLPELHALIERFNFATVITTDNFGEIVVSHVPVILDRTKGQNGTLIWHMANQNPHVQILNGKAKTLFVFHGPDAYISHTWYKTQPSVPTWNYVVVHAHGIPVTSTESELSDDLSQLVDQHELMIGSEKPYQISEDYKFKLLKHITGFRMEIIRIEGKFKLGQNRSLEDRRRIKQELSSQPDSQMLAELMGVI
jgi:transcriptional regulator